MASDEKDPIEVCPNCKAGWRYIEAGYGLAGGGPPGPYYYCTKCNTIFDKQPDPEL